MIFVCETVHSERRSATPVDAAAEVQYGDFF